MYKYFSPFEVIRRKTNDNNLGYSTSAYQYTRGISYIMYPGVAQGLYTINTEGDVFNLETQKLCAKYDAGNGYLAVSLRQVDGYNKNFYIHRLVAYQFCNPPLDITNYNVNHIDGNRYNNTCGNLEWVTIAANNQHARYVLNPTYSTITSVGKPLVDSNFVHTVCKMFAEGKSNTEIMRSLGMEINTANHSLLRDIRSGETWKGISSQYTFDRSSKKHAYTKEQQKEIEKYIKEGLNDFEIFEIMQGRPYDSSKDRRQSEYRSIQSRRAYMAQTGRI